MTEFKGEVFAARLQGRRPAALVVRPGSVQALADNGERFELPIDDAVYELGGATGRILFCRMPDGRLSVISEDPRFLAALTAAAVRARPRLVELERTLQAASQRRRAGWALGVVAVLLLVLAAPTGLGLLAEQGVRHLPRSVDVDLGKGAGDDFGGAVVKDPAVQAAANALLARLLEGAGDVEGFEFTLNVVRSEEANAFALPGGRMVLLTGLLEQAARIEQVAGVLAHEIAHVTERHGLERVVQSVGTMGLLQMVFGDAGGAGGMARDLFAVNAINGYSRHQESDADAKGVRLLHAAAIDPTGLSEFFENMALRTAQVPTWFSTHPDDRARVRAVRTLAEQLGPRRFRPVGVTLKALRGEAD